MTKDEFEQIDAILMNRANEVLLQRGRSYASDTDRFANFKEVARQTGLTPRAVCHLYLLKGMSVVNKLARGEHVDGETLEERFGDAINYLRLLYVMLRTNYGNEIDTAIVRTLNEAAEEARKLMQEGVLPQPPPPSRST